MENSLFLITLIWTQLVVAQEYRTNNNNSDTLVLIRPVSFLSLGAEPRPQMVQLESKNIKFPPIHENGLFRFITINDISASGIRFKKCFIGSIVVTRSLLFFLRNKTSDLRNRLKFSTVILQRTYNIT